MIEAQSRLQEQEKLWTIVEPAFSSQTLKSDMRPAARKEILNYMQLYR
jgi:hypothetical protein